MKTIALILLCCALRMTGATELSFRATTRKEDIENSISESRRMRRGLKPESSTDPTTMVPLGNGQLAFSDVRFLESEHPVLSYTVRTTDVDRWELIQLEFKIEADCGRKFTVLTGRKEETYLRLFGVYTATDFLFTSRVHLNVPLPVYTSCSARKITVDPVYAISRNKEEIGTWRDLDKENDEEERRISHMQDAYFTELHRKEAMRKKEASAKRAAICRAVKAATRDRRVSDLTTEESVAVKACVTVGLY